MGIEILKPYVEKILEDASPQIILGALFIYYSFYILKKANVIYDFLDKFNKRELFRLKELLADENISQSAKNKLRDKIDLIAYKKITGLSANIYLQKKIIKHYELSEGRLKYSDFKITFSFLKIDSDGHLYIRKTKWHDWLLPIYFGILSLMLSVILSLLMFVFVYAPISTQIRIVCAILLLAFSVLLGLCFAQTSSVFIVKKVREEINRNSITLMNQGLSKKLRPYGLNEGEFVVPDDFDDPLPEDIMGSFEGK